MSTRFSLEAAKASLIGDVGYTFDLASPFDAAKLAGGLASSAQSFLNSAIKCFLVGFDEPGKQLLVKAGRWLEAAVDSDERPPRYFPNGTEAIRLYDLALCRWLAHDVHDVDLLKRSIEFRERYFDKQKRLDRIEFSLVLPEYLDAERFPMAARRAPILWKSGKSPLEFKVAAVVANRLVEKPIDLSLIDELLMTKAPKWLQRGHFDLAAKWIKVIRWFPDRSRSALETIAGASMQICGNAAP